MIDGIGNHKSEQTDQMNKTVLIIDDDDILRDAIARGLRDAGFDVIGAPSVESATKILERIRPDGIVLDRMMTGIDGLTFLNSLRTCGNTTPVIMLTALTGPENAIAGLTTGADDYLGKPFQMRELILRLNKIMNRAGTHPMRMPHGLTLSDDEFFITDDTGTRLLALSGEEKKLLTQLTTPVGNIAAAAPMVAKRLRGKLNGVLSHIDIVTIRGRGYKLVISDVSNKTKGTNPCD